MSSKKHAIVELADWLQTDPGRYMQNWEQTRVDAVVSDIFGYHALQVGMAQIDLLRANRMPNKALTSPVIDASTHCSQTRPNFVLCESEALPFESQSIDLLVLSHGLELSARPHQVLREVERVLVPDGRVVISGFNPFSLWGLRHSLPYLKPWLPYSQASAVSLPRLKDWLKLLSFDIDRGYFGCYVPPFMSESWLKRFSLMEHAGDRWWPVCGAVYVLSAVKRVEGMRLIKPSWRSSQKLKVATKATGVAMNHEQQGN
jgi:SAM-dependent methyltransferase